MRRNHVVPEGPRCSVRATRGDAGRSRILVGAVVLLITAHAGADTWTNGAGSGLWSGTANWADGSEPTSADPVIFPSPIPGGQVNVALSSSEQAANITLNDSYLLGGGFVTLFGAGGNITVAGGKTATIRSSINGNVGLTKGGAGTLFLQTTGSNGFTGPVAITGTLRITKDSCLGNAANAVTLGPGVTTGTLQTTLSMSTSRTISPGIFGGTISANSGTQFTINGSLGGLSNPITFNGPGTVVLGAASTRNGSTTIQNGTVRLNNGAGLGTLGSTVSSNGRLEIGAGVTTGAFTSLQNSGTVRSSGAGAVHSGSISVGGAATVHLDSGDAAAHTLTIGDYDGGSGSTTLVHGAGTVVLSGAGNNYSGQWLVTGGTLRLAHVDAITSSSSPVVIGSTATVIAETASNYAGGWTVDGLLRLQNATGLGVGSSAVPVGTGGTLQIEGVNLARDIALNGGGTIKGAGSAAASGTLTAANAVPLLNLATGTAAGDTLVVSNYAGGSGSMTRVTGSGEVVLSNANAYGGTWQVSGGSLRVDHPDALGTSTAPVTVNSGGQFHISCGNYPHPITLNNGARLAGSGTAVTAAAGQGVAIAPGASVTFRTLGNPTGLIVGDGLNELTGGGGGSSITLAPSAHVSILSFFNTYTGSWFLRDGSSLFIVHDESLGDLSNALSIENASLLTSGTFSTSRPLIFSGLLQSGIHASSGTLTINSGLQGGTGTLFLDGDTILLNAPATLSGFEAFITTSLKLNHNQALATIPLDIGQFGSVELGTNITLSQQAFLNNGAVLRGNNNSHFNGTITVDSLGAGVNLGTVAVGDVFTMGNSLTGGSASSVITASGPGTIVLTQNSSYAGDWLVGGGVLQISNASGGATGNGTVTVASGATLTGTGSIVPSEDLLNEGMVSPGTAPVMSAGRLRTHRYTPGSSGVLKIEIGGPTAGAEHDRLEATGLATLAGTLDIDVINLFQPQIGQSFVILSHGSRIGTFEHISGMSAGPGRVFRVLYNPANVTLVVAAAAPTDLDEDGDVDGDDFAVFAGCVGGPAVPYAGGCTLQPDGSGHIAVDFDQDGDVDADDFGVFQRCYSGAGLPADAPCAQ